MRQSRAREHGSTERVRSFSLPRNDARSAQARYMQFVRADFAQAKGRQYTTREVSDLLKVLHVVSDDR